MARTFSEYRWVHSSIMGILPHFYTDDLLGYVEGEKIMLSIYIQNTKTIDDIADYEYVVMVNAQKIAEGSIEGHKRGDGWQPLVRRIVEQEEK